VLLFKASKENLHERNRQTNSRSDELTETPDEKRLFRVPCLQDQQSLIEDQKFLDCFVNGLFNFMGKVTGWKFSMFSVTSNAFAFLHVRKTGYIAP
jgi:hypothetical protein